MSKILHIIKYKELHIAEIAYIQKHFVLCHHLYVTFKKVHSCGHYTFYYVYYIATLRKVKTFKLILLCLLLYYLIAKQQY